MKAKMPCTLALALLENQTAMAAGTFNSSLAPFSDDSSSFTIQFLD
jgi:hypothetical protein